LLQRLAGGGWWLGCLGWDDGSRGGDRGLLGEALFRLSQGFVFASEPLEFEFLIPQFVAKTADLGFLELKRLLARGWFSGGSKHGKHQRVASRALSP
jgi:hypothetical protein